MLDKLLVGGTVVTKDGRNPANIGIVDGKIALIASPDMKPEAKEVIDVTGKFIIPGAIDAHVHCEDPGHTDREDFEHCTAAAAVGGVTTTLIMPTNDPLIFSLDAYKLTLEVYKDRAYVDYGIHGGVDDASFAANARELWEETGITALKAFMCFSSVNMGYINDKTLYELLELVAEKDGIAIIHCENDGIVKLGEATVKAAGRTDRASFNESRPGYGEVEAIKRVAYFAKRTGARVSIPHISTAEGLMEVRKAKQEGAKLFAESCGQYFTFTNKDFDEKGPYLKFTPVMRDQANQDRMWELIKEGYVDTIASDHSPFSKEEKDKGLDDIWAAPNGIPGLEPELCIWLNAVNNGKLELEDVVRMTSFNPANEFRLPGKGRIEVGYDADLVVVDMDKEQEFTADILQTKCGWSPYEGKVFKGWPVMTMVRGTVVAENSKLVGAKGYGKRIDRAK